MRKGCIYIIFSVLYFFVNAQEHYIKPAKLLTKFHFRQLSGGVMLINARLNNIPDTLNFILDTGSGGISLDSATCLEFKIPHVPSGRTINGLAGVREVDFSKDNELHLSGLTVNKLDFYINDYDILSSVYGEKIDGIIGYSFFSRYIVKIDADSLMVEVYQPGDLKYPTHGFLMHPKFTSLPITPLTLIDSKTFVESFYFDTGAGLSLLLNREYINDSSVLRKGRKSVITQAQGLGGKKQMELTVIKELKLGPYTFHKVPTHILDDEFNVTSYPYLGGLIGNDILRRFNLILNYQKKEIYITPNSHFYEPFDYSYTGMSIYNINGKIIIDDVIPKSPAYKAGFMKNDVVLSINNNFSNNLVQLKNILNGSTDKMHILIVRNGVPILKNFTPGRIY